MHNFSNNILSDKTRDMLISHYEKYPSLQIRDIFKYLFQSAFGCEHLVSSPEAAIGYIAKEHELRQGDPSSPIDPLDGAYSRVHLSYLDKGISAETFGRLFCLSAKVETDGRAALEEKLAVARELAANGTLPFSAEEFDREASEWRDAGFPPIHHSDTFRECYSPAYRVISNKYLPFLPLLARLDRLMKEKSVVLAIDGGSAGGKSTLGELLLSLYGCTLIHMDDFFLRPEQRTAERFAEVGGNIDRERFLCEVLSPLGRGEPIDYRKFDCSSMTVLPAVRLEPKRLTVIEGAYSMHPAFSGYYDLSVFLDVSPELQRERILKRNSPKLAERFFSEWIPLESVYFSEMNVKSRCDLRISAADTEHGTSYK